MVALGALLLLLLLLVRFALARLVLADRPPAVRAAGRAPTRSPGPDDDEAFLRGLDERRRRNGPGSPGEH